MMRPTQAVMVAWLAAGCATQAASAPLAATPVATPTSTTVTPIAMPGDPELALLEGIHAFRAGDDAAAVAALDRSIALDPTQARAHFFRGLTALYASDARGAAQHLARATELDPAQPEHWFEHGRVLLLAESPQLARASLEQCLQRSPPPAMAADAHYMIGTTLHDTERERARQHYEAAIALHPQHRESLWNLGLYHQLYGEPRKALECFQAVLALNPQDANALSRVIQAHHLMNDDAAAVPLRQQLRALILGSTDPEVHGMREFLIDQFPAEQGRWIVYESTATDVRDGVLYLFSFRLVVDGKLITSIHYERSSATVLAGAAAVIGWNEGGRHFTSPVALTTLPPYSEMKRLALQVYATGNAGMSSPTRRH